MFFVRDTTTIFCDVLCKGHCKYLVMDLTCPVHRRPAHPVLGLGVGAGVDELERGVEGAGPTDRVKQAPEGKEESNIQTSYMF